jgi:hypothetical protein
VASEGSSKVNGSTRRPRTAAEQRAERASSDDPEVLAAEIEKTREELAETLDAIADKVSPKRVASRTKKKVGDAVKDGAEGAAATVKAGTSQLKDAVKDKTDVVKDKVEVVKDKVGGDDATPSDDSTQTLAVPVPATTTPAGSPGASATSAASSTSLRAVPPPPASGGSPLKLGPPATAGALAAALIALVLLRRRRSSRRRWH